MANLRVRKSTIQVKTEVTEGVDPLGWASTDCLALTAVSEALNFDTQQLNEFGGSLDAGETIVGAAKPTLTARGALRGSGTPETPIVPFSALMKSSGFIESSRAATLPSAAVQAVTTATANTLTFPNTGTGTQWPATTAAGLTGATAVIGEVVELAGDPVIPTTATIIDYAVSGANITVTLSRNATDCGAATAVFTATTTVRIQKSTKWVTGSPTPHPSVTARQFRDGIMQLFTGCRPTARFTLTTGSFPEFEFGIGGQFTSRTDVAVPSAPTFLAPQVGVNGSCTFSTGIAPLQGALLGIQQCTFDLGNTGMYPDNLNQLTGIEPYIIGSRKSSGTVNPLLTLVATRNLLATLQAGTKGQLVVMWGPKTSYSAAVGNRFAFTFPNAKILDDTIAEDNVVLRETVNFEPTSFDNGVVITHY